MAGLTLIFDADGIEDSQTLLTRLEGAIRANANAQHVREATTECVIASAIYPFEHVTEKVYRRKHDFVFVDGSIHDERPSQEIFSILMSRDPKDLATVNGQYNAIVYEHGSRRLTIVTDRLATRPLYYTRIGSRHFVSSRIENLHPGSAISLNLSPISVLEMFAFGHNLATGTLFENVSVLPAGSLVEIDASGRHDRSYYRFSYREASAARSSREWGEAISSCVKSVAPHYVRDPDRTAVFLSGGLDSRLVAAALASAKIPLRTYTFGNPQSLEVVAATEIARRLGLKSRTFDLPQNYLSSVIEEVVRRNEACTPFFHTTSIVFHDKIAGEVDRILVGFGGGLSGSLVNRVDRVWKTRRHVANRMLHHALCASPTIIAKVFRTTFFEKYWPEVISKFIATVNAIDEERPENIPDVWNMRHRQPRFTYTAPKVDRHRFDVAAPLLDYRYMDLMTSLPVHARRYQLAYRYAILDGFPALSEVPWAKTRKPIPFGQAQFWSAEVQRYATKMFHRVLRKTGISGQRTSEGYRSIDYDMSSDQVLLSKHLERCLADNALPDHIFDRDGIRSLARDMTAGRGGKPCAHILGTALTLGLYFAHRQSMN